MVREKSLLREWIEILLEAAAMALIFYCVCWPVRVDGQSMMPTLNEGDRIAVSRAFVLMSAPARGELVICDIVIDGEAVEIIKRVVAVPGDLVEIRGGTVYVNGDALEEDYLAMGTVTSGSASMLLGEDEFFILGDNRAVSRDSRVIGAISRRDISARVLFRFYPFGGARMF